MCLHHHLSQGTKAQKEELDERRKKEEEEITNIH